METERIVVLCTISDTSKGAEVAKALVGEKLAACVNLIDGLRSIYSWEGEICDDPESLMVIKSRHDRFEALRARIVELHPYDTPEIIALPIVEGHEDYLKWIDSSLGSGGGPG